MSRRSNSEEEESNEVKVPDYVDKAGRRWHFLCHAKEEDLAQFVQQNGLVPGNENGKRRKFGCSRPECHFRAVFLKANSGIYTRGEHWHEHLDGEEGKTLKDTPNERIICHLSALSMIVCRSKEEFLISHGKEFRLICRFEREDEFEEYRKENWFRKRRTQKDRIYLCCRRAASGRLTKLSTNCRVFGFYVKHNLSLYQNKEQHNHPMGKGNEDYFSRFLSKYAEDKKANYVDHKGRHWQFLRQIANFEEFKKCAKKQMLYGDGSSLKKIYLKCKFAENGTLKNHPYPPPYCKMRAIFVKATSSIYLRNEHSNHPPFKLKSLSTRHGKYYKKLANFFEVKNAEKNMENAEQNEPTPKEEADSAVEEEGEEEVRIVKHLQRDYKCLGRMKREGNEEGESRAKTDSDSRADHTIQLGEEDLEEGTSQGTSRSRGTFFRYTQRELGQSIIKKVEPEEEEEAEPAEAALPMPQPQLPANIAWLQQFQVARPAKMLLRERKKRINYDK